MAEQRQLTVSRLIRPSRSEKYPKPRETHVPFVRMEGYWLQRVGFEIGGKVQVEVEPGRLVLTPREA